MPSKLSVFQVNQLLDIHKFLSRVVAGYLRATRLSHSARHLHGGGRLAGSEGVATDVTQPASSQRPHRPHHLWQDGAGA